MNNIDKNKNYNENINDISSEIEENSDEDDVLQFETDEDIAKKQIEYEKKLVQKRELEEKNGKNNLLYSKLEEIRRLALDIRNLECKYITSDKIKSSELEIFYNDNIMYNEKLYNFNIILEELFNFDDNFFKINQKIELLFELITTINTKTNENYLNNRIFFNKTELLINYIFKIINDSESVDEKSRIFVKLINLNKSFQSIFATNKCFLCDRIFNQILLSKIDLNSNPNLLEFFENFLVKDFANKLIEPNCDFFNKYNIEIFKNIFTGIEKLDIEKQKFILNKFSNNIDSRNLLIEILKDKNFNLDTKFYYNLIAYNEMTLSDIIDNDINMSNNQISIDPRKSYNKENSYLEFLIYSKILADKNLNVDSNSKKIKYQFKLVTEDLFTYNLKSEEKSDILNVVNNLKDILGNYHEDILENYNKIETELISSKNIKVENTNKKWDRLKSVQQTILRKNNNFKKITYKDKIKLRENNNKLNFSPFSKSENNSLNNISENNNTDICVPLS